MGAPKGNTNALKHNLYGSQYSPRERANLRRMSPDDFRHEIYMLRVAIKNIFEIQSSLHKTVERIQDSSPSEMLESLARITNSLSIAVTSLSTIARTHALLGGADASLNDAFERGLNSLSVFLDDNYHISSRSDKEDLAEVLVE
jgi:hypothetical protein